MKRIIKDGGGNVDGKNKGCQGERWKGGPTKMSYVKVIWVGKKDGAPQKCFT